MTGELGWDDLATAALLGTARREVRPEELPGPLAEAAARVPLPADPAARLLEVAALATLYRRAGMRPAGPRELPAPTLKDDRPTVRPAADARLDLLLGTADPELLGLWLQTATERGWRPPDRLLPQLLDQAARSRALAPVIAAAVGARGRWLARYRQPWALALAAAAQPRPGASSSAPPWAEPVSVEDPSRWQLGSAEERRSWLVALRRNDSEAARELLRAGWAREVPAERSALLGVLEHRLGTADEPFLEQALADRRLDVRAVAARLLSSLPESAYARRASARALAAVSRETRLLSTRLVVQPPTEHDAELARDQIPAPPTGRPSSGTAVGGPGAWLLLHVVAAAPLQTWMPACGRTPVEVVGTEVADGWGATLWEGWARAAVRERDSGWAAALLLEPPEQPTRDPRDEVRAVGALLDLLPAADRAEPVARLVRSRGAAAFPVLAALPGPWPDLLARTVMDWLSSGDEQVFDLRPVLELAGRRLPVRWADELRDAAMDWPFDSPARRLFRQAADLTTFRRELLEELQ